MRKKIRVLFCAWMLVFCMGCQTEQTDPMAAIYNDETKISNPYSYYEIAEAEQEINGQSVTGNFSDMNGMVMLWTYDAGKDTALEVRYFFKVTEGKVKLVLVDPDESVHTIAEFTKQDAMSDYEAEALSIREGLSRIKLVGTKDAVVEFDIQISEGDFIAMKK